MCLRQKTYITFWITSLGKGGTVNVNSKLMRIRLFSKRLTSQVGPQLATVVRRASWSATVGGACLPGYVRACPASTFNHADFSKNYGFMGNFDPLVSQ